MWYGSGMSYSTAPAEATFEVGDIVRYTAPVTKWGAYTFTGPVLAKRTMKATGKTFYRVGISNGITADMLEKVEVPS